MTLRLAVDARWLSEGPPSGRRVTTELVRSLSREPDIELVIVTRRSLKTPRRRAAFATSPHVRCIQLPRLPHPLVNALALPMIARMAGCNAIMAQNYAPLPISRLPAIVLIYDAIFKRDAQSFRIRDRLLFSLIRPMSASAQTVATISQTELQHLKDLGFARPTQRTVVASVGVDPPPTRSTPRIPGPAQFLMVGRLNKRKRIDLAIQAMAEEIVPPSAHLTIAGPPDNAYEGLVTVAEKHGVASRVHFRQHVPEAELAELYRSSHALLFLSTDEGFGLPLIEAMAHGTPVIASDIPVHAEVVGDAALLVKHDPRAIAEAMVECLNLSTRLRLRCAGLRRKEEFPWTRFTQVILNEAKALASEEDDQTASDSAPIDVQHDPS